MTLNEIPAWNEIESQPWFAALTPEEKQQSLQKWQGTMMQFASDPKEKFAVAATAKAKARSFFGEEMPDDPIADALQRRQKDLGDIGSRYDAFSKGQLEEDDEEVLTLNDTLKGNTPYSVIKGRLFVSPQLVWDKAAYEKVVNEAPVDEDERVLAMSAYEGSKERAAEGVVNSLGYTDEEFRNFAAKGFKEGKSNAAILDEWKANNKLPEGILGSLRGVGRQAYFGLRSGLSGLERAMGGLGGFFGSESAQKYAEESGKEAQSYMQRTLGEGPEFIGELTSGAVSIIPTMAAGAAASLFTEGAALPAAASITAGAIQSAGATQAETYEFYRNQGLDHANALAESRVDGLVSGLITGAITHYAGKLGDKIGLGKGIEGLFSGPASKIASKLTQREISESLKAGAKAVGGSFLQEGSEELLDQAAQDAYSMIKRDPTLTLAEAINNALQAGKVGAVLGGVAEAGKLGLKSLLNSAKFAVPTTEEEEALRAKFEVPAAVEEEVIASPEVQQEEQNVKTAADVVKETAPVAPQTAAVLAGITEEKAGELAADVVVKTGDALASVEEEAPLVVDETPLVLPASETITPTEAGPPVEELVTPAVTTAPLAPIPTEETQQPQPVETPTNAAPEITLEESLRQEPQDRVEVGTPEETGVGDSIQRAAEGEKEVGLPVETEEQRFVRIKAMKPSQRSDEDVAFANAFSKKQKEVGLQIGETTRKEFLKDYSASTHSRIRKALDQGMNFRGLQGTVGSWVETLFNEGWRMAIDARGNRQFTDGKEALGSSGLGKVGMNYADFLSSKQTQSPPTTGAVPPKTLPAGQKVTPRGVASPGVAAEAAPEPAPEAQPEQARAKINLGSLLGAINAMPEDSESRVVPGAETPVTDAKSGYSPSPNWVRKPGFKARAQELFNKYFPQVAIVEAAPGQSFGGSVVMGFTPTDGFGYRIFLHELGHALSGLNPELFKTRAVRAELDAISQDDFYLKNVLVGRGSKYTLSPGEVIAEFNAARFALPELNERFPELAAALDAAVSKTPSLNKLSSREAELLSAKVAKAQEAGLERLGENAGNGSAYATQWQRIVDASESTDVGFIRQVMDEAKKPFVDPDTGELIPWSRADFVGRSLARQIAEGSIDADLVVQLNQPAPASPQVQAFRDAVSQMSPTAQAKWTPELRATAEAYLDSGGTTGLQGLSDVQQKVVGRFLPEDVKAAFDAEDARKRAQRNKLPDHRESSLPPTPGKQIRKIGKGAMGSVPVVLDEIAKVIPNIRDLVEVRESVEGEPDAEGFYDPQADKAVVLVDNVYLKPQHGGSQEAALRETIIHELLHRGFAKLRQTNPQLFEQFEAFSLADTNDAQFEALVRRGYSMYSDWKDDPAQNQKAREEIFIRKAVVDLNFKGIEALKSPTSLASQFFSWLRGLLNKLLGRKVDDETLLHWSRVFLNAAQADFIEKTPGERMHAFAGEKAIENLPEERRQFMRDSLETAKAMAAAGKDSEEIRAVTGWFPGKYDGKMRWEVPDEGFAVVADVISDMLSGGKSGALAGELITHPNLFDTYKDLKDLPVVFADTGDASAQFTELANGVYAIRLNREKWSPSSILHEIQHWIQRKEGFARGSNLSEATGVLKGFKDAEEFSNALGQLEAQIAKLSEAANAAYSAARKSVREKGYTDEAERLYDESIRIEGEAQPLRDKVAALRTVDFRDAFDAYSRVAGEIEARDVQARQKLTPEQRAATAPYSSENIAPEDAIVMFGGGGAQMSMASPEKYARHAELEAKHNAGTITPEETAEAQALVDEAAKNTFPSLPRVTVLDVRGKPVEVIKNASRRERKSLESDGMVGEILLPSGETLSFNRMDALHGEVLNRLGIRKAAVVTGLLYPDGFLVTDRTSPELSENPSTPKRIRSKYRVEEVGFYNDAIVGAWDELPTSSTPLDPFTGVPLEQRFGPSPDIRYSLGEPPDTQAEADALREVTPSSQALDKFRETFGTPRQDVGQVLGKKEGSVYTQAQVAPLSQHARNVIGFDVNEEGDPVVNPKATQKALDLVSKLLNTKGYASRFNTQAAKLFEGTPVDPEIASAVLVQELQAYANRLSASSPKAEDQILKAALTPFYNTVILGNYLTLRTAGRALQAAGRVSNMDDARKSREEAEKAVNKEIAKQLGDEALPAAEGMDKAGVEGGVDAIKDDIPAPADPTLRLLDLAVESLDEVAKAKTERVFDILFEIGQLEELVAQDEKVGNKAMSILRNPNLAARNYPTDPAERKALLAQKKAELATALDEALASLQGAKPETRKKVKAKAAKTKSKTDGVQKLIDKLSKMPDESKEAKPKAETLRAAIADAIKEKEFDEQKVRDAATKFGATPEQTERLVDEAERIHEIRQSPKLSKAKLRQFLLSFPKNVLANPEQREALLRSFLKGQNYSEAEINRIVPQVLRDFDTGYQKARKAYLDELEKKLKPKQGQKESKQDQQNRKMLNALRSGLADTTSETSVALAKSLGFEAFRPQDDHILSKLDEEMRKLREQDRISDANAKFVQIRDLLNRRRPPRDFMQVAAQGWITSALSSLSNFAVNVWAPLGEAGVRFTSDILRAAATGRIDEIPLYLEAAIQALKSMPPRAKFAFKTDTFTNSVNTLIADMASMKDELQRALNTYRSKDSSKLAKAAAAGRILFTIGDLSRRVLSTVDDTWYTALSSYIGSSNLIKDLRDAKLPKAAVQAIAFHANNDAIHQAQAEHATLDAVSQFVESLRGKTEEEIDAGLEYLGLNDASVTQAQADYIQEIVSALQSLRIRSGATGDDLVKRALKEISNFKAAVNVRAVELGQARTKELLATALTEVGQTPQQIEEAQRNYDENAKKAASFGMGLHRVEGVPSYDIMGKAVQIVDAMGRGAVTTSPLLGRMMVGFFGIPLNLLNKSLWFTPYGLGRYFLAKWQMAKNPEEKFYEYSMSSQREMSQRVNEIIIGHTIMAAAFALGAIRDQEDEEGEGLYITLGGPSNKTEYDAWYARGFRKFSFCYKTKDGSVAAVPYGRGMGEVLKMPLMLLGAFDDMRLNKKLGDREDMSSIIEYLNSAAAGIGNQATFLGAKNTVGAFAPDKIGANTASSIAYAVSNLVPFNGLDRSIAALAVGPPDRSRTGAILANIPIARWLATDPAINVFGDKWGNKSDASFAVLWDRQWNQGLIPLNISAPLTGQDKRLYGFIGERLIGPSPALRGALELRNGYVTDKQWYDYSIYRGQALKREMLTQLDRLRRMDDDSLSKAIAELSTKATKKAKDRFNYK